MGRLVRDLLAIGWLESDVATDTFKRMDQDEDGRVTREEFIRAVTEHGGPASSNTSEHLPKSVKSEVQINFTLLPIFLTQLLGFCGPVGQMGNNPCL